MGLSNRTPKAWDDVPETDEDLDRWTKIIMADHKPATLLSTHMASTPNGSPVPAGTSDAITRRLDAIERQIGTLVNELSLLQKQRAAERDAAVTSTIRPTDAGKSESTRIMTEIAEKLGINLSSVRDALAGRSQHNNRWLPMRRYADRRAALDGREYDGRSALTTDSATLRFLLTPRKTSAGTDIMPYQYIQALTNGPSFAEGYRRIFALLKVSSEDADTYLAPFRSYSDDDRS